MARTDPLSGLLDEFFEQHLAIAEYLNMRAVHYSPERFSLAIDLSPSLNDKLTAFGGSLYCACVMNCWGMVYLQARARGFNPNMVVRHGEIDYLAPVDDAVITASCEPAADVDWAQFFNTLTLQGRAQISLSSTIVCRGREAVRFNGRYAVVGLKSA